MFKLTTDLNSCYTYISNYLTKYVFDILYMQSILKAFT